jgi:proteic killer suppression protein
MQLDYATRDLGRVCTDARRMQTTYGANVAKKLKLRLAELILCR